MTVRVKQRKVRLDVSRNDVAVLLDALESVIEDYKYDGGLVLAEDEMRLENYLRERLSRFDQGRPA